MRLEGRVVIVTGAAAGIGRACVERFHAEGASVVAADRSGSSLKDLAESAAGPLETVRVDVTEEGSAAALVQTALDTFGRFDVFHANAGGAFPTPFDQVADETYTQILALNLDAVWQGAKASMPHFVKNGGGIFLATSSGAGINAVGGLAAYGAAKAGVQSLVKNLSLEYGTQGIRANAIAPGSVESPGILSWIETLPGGLEKYIEHKPMGRLGRPEEIAATAAFLASDDSSFINGVTIPVDGGATTML